jgi:lipopolysaccharide heptosyltransferase II
MNQIGDLVFSLPLLRALRENYPDSTIHSVVKPYLRDLLTGLPYVDDVFLRKSGLKEKLNLLREIRRNRYDLVISLSNSVECLLLTALSSAKRKVGFSNFPWDLCLDLKEKVEGHHGWHNYRKLLKRLDLTVEKGDYVGLLIPSSPGEDLRELVESQGFDVEGRYVIISPGTSARRKVKQWEEEKFAEVIVSLKERYDLNPVLVGGKDNEELNEKIAGIAKEKYRGEDLDMLNLTGKVELKDLCSFMKDASLFVGIDSGIMHLASSMDMPVVGIFGPTDPFYVGPQSEQSIVVREEEVSCVPCYLKGCDERTCMKEVSVDKVLSACKELMDHPARRWRRINSQSPGAL